MEQQQIEIVGVYPVPGHEGVHLVEVFVRESPEAFDIGGFTQEIPDRPEEEWEVTYDERYLNQEGDEVTADVFDEPSPGETTRAAFFFHGLDPARPLLTPFGAVELPPPMPMPERLARIITYEPPE